MKLTAASQLLLPYAATTGTHNAIGRGLRMALLFYG